MAWYDKYTKRPVKTAASVAGGTLGASVGFATGGPLGSVVGMKYGSDFGENVYDRNGDVIGAASDTLFGSAKKAPKYKTGTPTAGVKAPTLQPYMQPAQNTGKDNAAYVNQLKNSLGIEKFDREGYEKGMRDIYDKGYESLLKNRVEDANQAAEDRGFYDSGMAVAAIEGAKENTAMDKARDWSGFKDKGYQYQFQEADRDLGMAEGYGARTDALNNDYWKYQNDYAMRGAEFNEGQRQYDISRGDEQRETAYYYNQMFPWQQDQQNRKDTINTGITLGGKALSFFAPV